MELKTFKKRTHDIFILNGFSKQGSYYHKSNGELIFAIGLQKSNFSGCYYFNIGLIIKELNPNLKKPRDVDGDIRARFSFEGSGKKIDCFEIHDFAEEESEKLTSDIQNNIDIYVSSITSLDKLKELLEIKPVMLYQTTSQAKEFLGL